MRYFYLGTHQPNFLATAGVRLFVSHRRLAARKTLPRAAAGWALDSGGFSELSLYGDWRTTARDYNAAVRRYDDEIGKLEWAAIQDDMCEWEVLARTGLSIPEHQRRTVDSLCELQDLWDGTNDSPYMSRSCKAGTLMIICGASTCTSLVELTWRSILSSESGRYVVARRPDKSTP